MPDQDHTAIGLVIDKSGSMQDNKQAAIDGYNELLSEQQKIDGRVTVFRTMFNHHFPPDIRHESLDDFERLDDETYSPTGRTALIDAVGYTIDEMGDRFDKMDEDDKPSSVIVGVITDGKENASEEYTKEQLRSKIEQQEEEWDWEFIFIGAGIDDFSDARQMGIHTNSMISEDDGYTGYKKGVAKMDAAVSRHRKGETDSLSSDNLDDEAAVASSGVVTDPDESYQSEDEEDDLTSE